MLMYRHQKHDTESSCALQASSVPGLLDMASHRPNNPVWQQRSDSAGISIPPRTSRFSVFTPPEVISLDVVSLPIIDNRYSNLTTAADRNQPPPFSYPSLIQKTGHSESRARTITADETNDDLFYLPPTPSASARTYSHLHTSGAGTSRQHQSGGHLGQSSDQSHGQIATRTRSSTRNNATPHIQLSSPRQVFERRKRRRDESALIIDSEYSVNNDRRIPTLAKPRVRDLRRELEKHNKATPDADNSNISPITIKLTPIKKKSRLTSPYGVISLSSSSPLHNIIELAPKAANRLADMPSKGKGKDRAVAQANGGSCVTGEAGLHANDIEDEITCPM